MAETKIYKDDAKNIYPYEAQKIYEEFGVCTIVTDGKDIQLVIE